MNASRTVDQIQSDLDQQNKLMFIHQKNGNYLEAEKSRLKIEELTRNLEARTLLQMERRHRHEKDELSAINNAELAAFNDYWNKKVADVEAKGARTESDLTAAHKQDLQKTRQELQIDLSPKVKESSQLLNLRKMQEHMVKQKNFAEAHKVQQQIFNLQKAEKEAWMQKRNERMETALNTLRGKQAIELANLRKRIKTELDELSRERKIEQQRLLQKYENLHRDLKNQQQKQILNYKGQFRSRGGRDSPIRSKSSFTS